MEGNGAVNKLQQIVDKDSKDYYNILNEGVASAGGVVSQHTDRQVWLASNCETHVML